MADIGIAAPTLVVVSLIYRRLSELSGAASAHVNFPGGDLSGVPS